MAEPLQLVLIDTTGIQEFVFRSNRLRENLGGSYLGRLCDPGLGV
jgi:hypothetical protein